MATVTRRGDSWVLNWHDNTGQHRKVIGKVGVMSEREAQRQLKIKEYELATGQAGRTADISVGTALSRYLAWHEAEYPRSNAITARRLQRILAGVLNQPLTYIDQDWMIRWKKQAATTLATSTAAYYHSLIKAFLRWCTLNDLRVDDKASKSRAPQVVDDKLPDVLTPEQLQALYDAAPDNAALWRFMVNTGIRAGEATRLQASSVSGSALRVVSTSRGSTKTGRSRVIPLSPGAREAWETLQHNLPRCTSAALSSRFARDCNKAGFTAHLHMLRHTFATTLLRNRKPLHVVQRLLGHTRVETTMVYAHVVMSDLEDATDFLTI